LFDYFGWIFSRQHTWRQKKAGKNLPLKVVLFEQSKHQHASYLRKQVSRFWNQWHWFVGVFAFFICT